MNPRDQHQPRPIAVDNEAADWVVRSERGLTPLEQDEFTEWLARGKWHQEAFAELRWSWEELDRLTGLQRTVAAVPNPALLAPPRKRGTWWHCTAVLSTAAVLAIGIALFPFQRPANSIAMKRAEMLAPCELQNLPDGSVVELNRGAAITVSFSSTQRHVRLDRGEAHFDVAKDPTKPFVVEAAGVEVRAVGTAFSVTRDSGQIAVLVTEGKVTLTSPLANDDAPPTLIVAGERALVPLAAVAAAPKITVLSPDEIADWLAWKPRILDFDNSTLADIANEFSRRNPIKLTVVDPSLRARRLSATIRSDNLEQFVNLLESSFGIRVRWVTPTSIELWPSN
ncbi:MAG: FecR domain-containing protein [Opitutaceae bacterium]|nr:FecR domain-containing protein [Opitutaceae bacterium]